MQLLAYNGGERDENRGGNKNALTSKPFTMSGFVRVNFVRRTTQDVAHNDKDKET